MWSNYFHYSENDCKETTKSLAYAKAFLKMYREDPTSVPKMGFTFKDMGKYVAIDNRKGKCVRKEFLHPNDAKEFIGLKEA